MRKQVFLFDSDLGANLPSNSGSVPRVPSYSHYIEFACLPMTILPVVE